MNKLGARRWQRWLWIAGTALGPTLRAQPDAAPPDSLAPERVTEEERMLEEALRTAASVPSFWSTVATLRTAAGYRDNVLLSTFDPVAAPLLSAGADVIVSRLPTDGTEVTLLGSADYTAFLDAPETDPEALALAQAGLTRELGSRWKAGLTAEYVFLHQVFDVSVVEAELSTVTARGHAFTLTPTASLDLGRGWSADFEGDGTRQLFSDPLDGYWEAKPALALVKRTANAGEIALTYTFGERWYDTRSPLDEDGDSLDGLLRFTAHELELRSTIFWDVPQRWRTRFRVGWLHNHDNGGGYFDFNRLAAGAQVQFRTGPWTVRAEGRARWYDYPVQHTDGPQSSLRQRTDLSLLVRGEFMLTRRLRWFLQYDRDSSDDNAPDASYIANGLLGGLEFDL